ESLRRAIESRTEAIIADTGGFDLWRTRDGRRWIPLTRTGFGNPYNFGGRTMVSTPVGLFLGSANPFGPEVAERTSSGWEYRPNPQGGLEILLASERCDSEKAERFPARTAAVRTVEPTAARVAREKQSAIIEKYNESMYDPFAEEFYGGSDFT